MNEFKLPELPNDAFEILPRQDYFNDLDDRLAKVGDGDMVMLLTMAFNPVEPQVERLLNSLEQAAMRGARVRLGIDAYAFLIEDETSTIARPGPLFFHKSLPRNTSALFRPKAEALTRLTKAGVDCTMLNMPRRAFTFPFKGRSHIKLALINDRAYVGGCNLGVATTDIMVAFENARSATWLWEWANKIVDNKSSQHAFMLQDTSLALDPHTQLMFDAGKPGQSLIYDTALQLIDQAQEWILLTYQYFPNGPTLEHLTQAVQRGVKVTVYRNDLTRLAYPMNIGQGLSKMFNQSNRSKGINFVVVSKRQPFLHAKILATEQAAMVGSHNYVQAGVNFGTAELTLLRRNPEFSSKLATAFKSLLQN